MSRHSRLRLPQHWLRGVGRPLLAARSNLAACSNLLEVLLQIGPARVKAGILLEYPLAWNELTLKPWPPDFDFYLLCRGRIRCLSSFMQPERRSNHGRAALTAAEFLYGAARGLYGLGT